MTGISPENLKILSEKYRVTAIIFYVQIGFTIALIAAGWLISANKDYAISDESMMSLRVGVIFIAITSFVLRRMLLRWDRLKTAAILRGIRGVTTMLQGNAVILGAMAEIIAIIGFLIAVLGGVKTEMFTFGAVALVLFLINFPRRSVWEKIVVNLQDV
ncbi:MAG: hypothetical protein KIS76_01165 [Pyrinomonadaceae bacterium]|nr:hypothetical protein [Pyrinomonadaceae bacterium]